METMFDRRRVSADGFFLFAKIKTQVSVLVLPKLTVVGSPFADDSIEVFRAFRTEGRKLRYDQTNISVSLFDDAIVLKELFLTPKFGISVVTDPAVARFEFILSTQATFSETFEFTTIDGILLQPHCYFSTYEQR